MKGHLIQPAGSTPEPYKEFLAINEKKLWLVKPPVFNEEKLWLIKPLGLCLQREEPMGSKRGVKKKELCATRAKWTVASPEDLTEPPENPGEPFLCKYYRLD